MPTPMYVYAEIAHKFGGVDPSDDGAVDKFFTEDVLSLPKSTQETILKELLYREGEEGEVALSLFYLKKELLLSINKRLDSILRAPGMWGSEESQELLFLQLLEFKALVLDSVHMVEKSRWVKDLYECFIEKKFPNAPAFLISKLRRKYKTSIPLVEFLARFRTLVEQRLDKVTRAVLVGYKLSLFSNDGRYAFQELYSVQDLVAMEIDPLQVKSLIRIPVKQVPNPHFVFGWLESISQGDIWLPWMNQEGTTVSCEAVYEDRL